MDDQKAKEERRHRGHGGMVWGFILVVLGFIFLIQEITGVDLFSRGWPVVLIVIGLSIIYSSSVEHK